MSTPYPTTQIIAEESIPREQVEGLFREAMSKLTSVIAVGYESGGRFIALEHFGPTSFFSEQSRDAFCEDLRQRLIATTHDTDVQVRILQMGRLDGDIKDQIAKKMSRTLAANALRTQESPRHRAH